MSDPTARGGEGVGRGIPPLRHRWILPSTPPDPESLAALCRELSLPAPLCALLAARGHGGVEAAKRQLRPLLDHLHPPESMADAPRAAERLLEAVRRGETILVHGDYDVDGISGAALYTLWLQRLGGRVVPFVPHRLRDGYDFGAAGLAAARQAGASVVLTADCGTVAHPWTAEAGRLGLDVIVTDHHTPGPTLPPAFAVLNPNREDCPYPEKGLCGTGVAFKLCQLLARERGVDFEELVPHLDLVALATIADLVPLTGENRTLARYGLRALERTAKPGLRALLEVTGTEGRVDAGKVGFVLAPRINAIGRLGDAAEGLRLLLGEDPGEARRLAERLDRVNRERQEEDRKTLDEALEMISGGEGDLEHGLVLAREGWHPGVIGIVASRVVERIHRPVVLVALDGDKGRGSGRSIPGFHLHEALVACSRHLGRFGGHRMAAGMDVERGALPAFRTAFEEEARLRLQGMDLRPTLRADLELAPGDATLELCKLLPHLGPHGVGNPRPVFLGRGLELTAPAEVLKERHLRLRLSGGGRRLDAIGFGLAERVPLSVLEGPLDVLFHLEADEYRGEERVRAKLLDVRAAAPGALELAPGREDRASLAPASPAPRGHRPGPAPGPLLPPVARQAPAPPTP